MKTFGTRSSDIEIRPIESADADAVQLFASDAALAATCNVPHPYPSDGGVKFVERAIRGRETRGRFASAVLNDQRFVGVVTLNTANFTTGTFEVDYWIARPFWGRGFATTAVGCALRLAFHELGLGTALSGCLPRNPASSRVLEKNGFREIDAIVNDGRFGTKFLGETIRRFMLKREEWQDQPAGKRTEPFTHAITNQD